MILDAVQFVLQYFVTMFVVISPLAIIALFVSMTAAYSFEERIQTAKTGCKVAFAVMVFFALAGEKIFEFFGISMGSFYIAGGVLVFLVGLDMLRAQDSSTQVTSDEIEESKTAVKNKEDISITPLGIPMIAGPCCITNTIAQQAKAGNWCEFIGGLIAIALVIYVLYLCLSISSRGAKWLTPTILRLSYRLSGLILAALAVEMFITGVKSYEFGFSLHQNNDEVIEQIFNSEEEEVLE